jgi:anti-sigma factor RsiW
MNCGHMQENLIVYLDGKAAPAARRQVEEHLAACPACRERAEQFSALWRALDEVPGLSPSPSFDAAVRQRVAAEPHRASWWSWLTPSPRLAVAATVLVVFSVWLSSQRPGPQPPMTSPAPQSIEAEFSMIQDLPVLEDYDVVASFDALSELSVQAPATSQGDSER